MKVLFLRLSNRRDTAASSTHFVRLFDKVAFKSQRADGIAACLTVCFSPKAAVCELLTRLPPMPGRPTAVCTDLLLRT